MKVETQAYNSLFMNRMNKLSERVMHKNKNYPKLQEIMSKIQITKRSIMLMRMIKILIIYSFRVRIFTKEIINRYKILKSK